MSWEKVKDLIHSIKPADFEVLGATLLKLFLKEPFVVARSGDQPSGDARSISGDITMQTKLYKGKGSPNAKTVEGDIRQAIRILPHLQVYVLAVSRDAAQLHDTLDAISEETGLDIVVLELSDELSDLGALCVSHWEDIHHFFNLSDTSQEFSAWVQIAKNETQTHGKMKDVRNKLKEGIQTQKHVQKDVEKHLCERFSRDKGFNPINLSQAVERKSLESKIMDWWKSEDKPICYLEGKEGHGKSWLAAKSMKGICENENVVTFWLDSKDWNDGESIFDLLYDCFSVIYPSYEQRKITKLQNKPAKIWRKMLIVLDGVNERNAIDAANRILAEYFRNDESEWRDRIRFLFTTRPLDDYPDFESYLWDKCHKISIDPFNDAELQEALTQSGLQSDDLSNSLKDIARIPRYFQTCLQLQELFHSFDNVTKEMVLWADLLNKIARTDPQIKQKFGWHRIKDAQEILADLAKQVKWTNLDDAPEASLELLEKDFPNYREIRHDLEEQNIAVEAGPLHAKLKSDHIILGWALYLSNLFDCKRFTGIKDFAEEFMSALEPIPSEDLRTKALFVALQITAISPDLDISQEQLSQKRAALMLAWFDSHNAKVTDEQLSFWVQEDTDAYAQVVEFKFKHHNSPNDEEILIAPLAKAWLSKRGQLNRLASRLKEWLFPTDRDNLTENVDHINREEDMFPTIHYTQNRLSAATLSILSQRPDPQFLSALARCYENSEYKAQFNKNIGRLMRWGYTEKFLSSLEELTEQSQHDEVLLGGLQGLASELKMVNLLSEKEKELRALVKQENCRFKSYIDRIRDQERLLIGNSPAANGNYHGLGYLAVRTDLPDLHREDIIEIKKILQDISVNAELGQTRSETLEGFCIENLMPWVARCAPESYAELACRLKLNALNQEWAKLTLRSIHGLIFKQEDRERITETILGMKQRLSQGKDLYQDVEDLTTLLTEHLLFSASEEVLTDWFKFLAAQEPLRVSICDEPLLSLLVKLLPRSIVRLARRKLETLRFSSNDGVDEFSEEEFWCTLYAYGTQIDKHSVQGALDELKLRKPDSTGTCPMLRLALSDPKRFWEEMLNHERIQAHLISKNGRRFVIQPCNESKDVPSYEVLRTYLPLEILGSFLFSADRRDDLSRWGQELMQWMCSILQGTEGDSNSVENIRFGINREVLQTWAEQNTTDFLQLANEYLTELSKSPWYDQVLSDFTDTIRCLLLRFQPDKAKEYYYQWNAESVKTVYSTFYGVLTFHAQLWKVECCNSSEHRQFRCELLAECLNDEEIMFMTLAALVEGGQEELWSIVTQKYLVSPYAKERNLGVSILPWFGTCEAIDHLERLKSKDPSQWVREHATWAYEVAQQERSCREVYRKALQTRDLFRISAVFEQIKPALSPTAKGWHYQIEKDEQLYEESQNIDPKLLALVEQFWYQWGKSSKVKRNVEVFRRKLREYCRGEKLSTGPTPRIAPWWKPASGSDSS